MQRPNELVVMMLLRTVLHLMCATNKYDEAWHVDVASIDQRQVFMFRRAAN